MERVTLTPVGNLDVLAKRWRALEVEADGGFFRSWTFLGCEATARFSRASLLSVTQDGVDVALGLLGTCNGQLWLNETGLPELDASFIEHNGLLVRRDLQASVPAALRHATQAGRAVVLSGIDDQMLGAAREAGWAVVRQSRFAPCVTLHTLKGPFLDTLSANARAQIRRSFRSYGPSLRLSRAATLTEALGWFEQMVQLHQTSWIRRGKPGAFAAATARKFHADLIARAWVRGETELLRIDAEGEVVGILYVFVQNGRALSYQSGFNYKPDNAREKPGLVCHTLAVEHFARQGAHAYDLLAGSDRYKLTLANEGETMHWASLYRPWSPAGVIASLRQASRPLFRNLVHVGSAGRAA